jgi:hypothetical protein
VDGRVVDGAGDAAVADVAVPRRDDELPLRRIRRVLQGEPRAVERDGRREARRDEALAGDGAVVLLVALPRDDEAVVADRRDGRGVLRTEGVRVDLKVVAERQTAG